MIQKLTEVFTPGEQLSAESLNKIVSKLNEVIDAVNSSEQA